MENINDILKNHGGENNQPQNTGYQNPVMTSTGYKNPTQPGGGYISPKPPKKDNKKLISIIAVIVAVVVVAVIAVVCVFVLGNKPKVTSYTNTAQYVENGTLDIEKIMTDGITVNGKKITFPCKVKDFGDDWRVIDEGDERITTKDEEANRNARIREQFGKSQNQENEPNGPQGRLTNGKQYVAVYFCEYSNTGYDDIYICGITGDSDCVDICGLSKASNATEEMKKLFGEPNEVFTDSDMLKGMYCNQYFVDEETMFIERMEIYISDEDNKFLKSRIVYYPQEYRREPLVQQEYNYAKIDISKIAENIKINGKKISLPCTVREMSNALGNEWFYKKNTLSKKKDDSFYNFYYESENSPFHVYCELKDYNPDIAFEDNIIDSFMGNFYSLKSFSIDWINEDTTLEEIENRYGKLKSDGTFYYLYDINSDNKVIKFVFLNETLDHVEINCKGE